jgi:hypothetical protein
MRLILENSYTRLLDTTEQDKSARDDGENERKGAVFKGFDP